MKTIKLKDTILVSGPCLHPEYNAKARQKKGLRAYFRHFGKVIKIILSKDFNKSTVTFDNSDSAMKCIEQGIHKIQGQDFLVRRGRFSNAMKMKLGAIPDETMPRPSKQSVTIPNNQIERPAVMTKRIFVSGPCLHPEKMDPIASQMEELYMYFGHFGEISDMSIKNDSYVIIFDNYEFDNYDECIQQVKHKICGQDFLVRPAAPKKRQKKEQHKKIMKKRLEANQERNMLGSSRENVSASNVQNNPAAKSNFEIQVSQSKTSSSSQVHGSVTDSREWSQNRGISTCEAKEIRRSARLAQMQNTKLENEIHGEPKAKKGRSENSFSNIATFDNRTLLEAFKYLNYYRLAKTSLVSKKYRDLIENNRRSLPLLYVQKIWMFETERTTDDDNDCSWIDDDPTSVKIFGEALSPEKYNEWIFRNNYSKQSPQIAVKQIAGKRNKKRQYERKVYNFRVGSLNGVAYHWYSVFDAYVELNDENWPLFQHFARLLTAPFIYIQDVDLFHQNDIFNLFTTATNFYWGRLQCEKLIICFERDIQIHSWVKDHVLCKKVEICTYENRVNGEKALLNFFLTGANCTSEIRVENCYISKVIFKFVQMFLNLENCDEYQIVESIYGGQLGWENVTEMKRNYAEFIVKEYVKNVHYNYEFVDFEFVNRIIGKKLKLTVKY
ncbi:hypothetical protein Ddc_14236 [Ditylenchus destructor]|nr:hypothetical protein Ddc_14236 [Ditylenchus destructor]